MTDLLPLPKPDLHGDILLFIYQKDEEAAEDGRKEGRQKGRKVDLQRREKLQKWG